MSVAFDQVALADRVAGENLLVALDIDGTILQHSGEISPAVREAVDAVADAGAHVVLSSGRSVHSVTPILAELGLETGWAVCSNGSVTVRLDPGIEGGYEFENVVTFDPAPALRLLREHLPEGVFAVEDIGRGYALTGEFPEGELDGQIRHVSFEEICANPAPRIVLRGIGLTSQDFHELVERCGLGGVNYAVGWTGWLDIAPLGTSKASALERVRGHLGVSQGNTVAVGDGQNDIEMLTWAGVGVAMGNADATTRAAANYHTGPVEDDGLVPVLQALLAD